MKRIKKLLHHFFLPHHSNNQRAKLLHFDTVLVIALFFLLGAWGLTFIKNTYPTVLGTSVNIDAHDLLVLTNVERQKAGLSPLNYNDQLALAAHNKAMDMFSFNYWAHINPKNGKTPWAFIQGAGYKYTYAGENLARGFSSAQDVISAWMASPTHKANVLSPNYQDVGFAIEQGSLTGENGTILVVEEFGGKIVPPLAQVKQAPAFKPVTTVLAEGKSRQVQQYPSITTSPVVDRFSFAKGLTQSLLILFIAIFLLDILLIERKNISRMVSHNLDHVLFLAGILLLIIAIGRGVIY